MTSRDRANGGGGPRAVRACSRDFGGTLRRTPRKVLPAYRESDIVEALAQARAGGLKLRPRGSGHSCAGQTLVDDGIVLANRADGSPRIVLRPNGQAEFAARARWGDVERQLNRSGRSIPVLADHLGLSVGGTLSVGGYGVRSIVNGAQVDHVTSLRLVLPNGDVVDCSRNENEQLFRHCLAGGGRLGIIETVTMQTVAHSPWTALHCQRFATLGELVRSFEWMEGWSGPWPDLFKALYSRGRGVSVYGVEGESLTQVRQAPPPAPSAGGSRRWLLPAYRRARNLAVKLWVSRFPLSDRVWFDYLLDFPGLCRFVELVEQLRRDPDFDRCLKSIFLLGVRRAADAPDFPFEAAGATGRGRLRFGVGLYCMVPRGATGDLAKVHSAARRCLERCIELGGRPYLYGWHELDETNWKALYGADYDQFVALRQELDPNGTLTCAPPTS